MIEFKNVCFAYQGIPALRFFNLNIKKGDTVVLRGPNGCGKSTILKVLNGLIYPDQGEYLFEGKVITEKSMKDNQFSKWFHQKIGYVFQNADTQLFCNSVEDEIAFGPRQMGLTEKEIAKRVEDSIQLLSIDKLRDRAPYHLSGGEKRKVAIACIISMNPEVLVLDEPLSGLDQKTQIWLIDFLKAIKKSGKTLIISSHNQILAENLADYFVEMNDEHEIVDIVINSKEKVDGKIESEKNN